VLIFTSAKLRKVKQAQATGQQGRQQIRIKTLEFKEKVRWTISRKPKLSDNNDYSKVRSSETKRGAV